MSDANSVDYLLQSVAARGLKLANLFQFEVQGADAEGPWRWQANVTDGEKCWEFGRGRTAVEALRAALFAAATSTGTPISKRRPSPPPTTRFAPEKALPVVEEDFRL